MEQGKDVVVKAPRTKDSSIFIFHLHLTYIRLILPFCTTWKHWPEMDISSPPVVLSGKGILKKCSKFTGEHPCRSVTSIKLGVTLWYGCSSENLLHIFRTPCPMNWRAASEWVNDPIQAGIEIAVGHWTLSVKKGYMSGTHISKPDILSCTLSLGVICGKSFKLKLV